MKSLKLRTSKANEQNKGKSIYSVTVPITRQDVIYYGLPEEWAGKDIILTPKQCAEITFPDDVKMATRRIAARCRLNLDDPRDPRQIAGFELYEKRTKEEREKGKIKEIKLRRKVTDKDRAIDSFLFGRSFA